jgi:hypothetical protein
MQARTWKYLIAVAGLAATAACADDQPATKVTMPRGPSLIISTACDFTKIKKDAKAYVVAANDPIYDLFNQLASLNKGTDAGAFNAKAYEILAYIGNIAGTSAVTTNTTAGDALINDIFVCLGITTTTAGQFTNALGANGLFAVRANVPDFVLSRGTPKYGAQPATGETWKTSAPLPPGLQLVVYGYPRNVNTFTGEPPLIPTGYELFTVPAVPSFAKAIIGGVCLDPASIPANARLLHEHGGQDVILNLITPPFCLPLLGQAPNESRGMFALVRRVTDWIAPKPLHAATTVLGGMGGSLGGLSPIGPVTVDGSTVTLTVTQQPTTGSINTNFNPPIKVAAATGTAPTGTPLGGVLVTLSVIGNLGSPVTLKGETATTDDNGVATFTNLQTNKAGGYLFKASGTFAGSVTKADTTTMINVNGQTP